MGTPAFEPERVLAGRYRLERRLGKGGMGTIWVAEHLVLQAPVAVKLIDRDAVPDEETIARFLREAKAAATLRSPHVVQILDYGMDENVPFIVMELLEGENLSQRLRRVTRLGPADTARIITHVGRAVGRAHEAGIVHRDLKPENVFLVPNEDEEIAKVLDFGVAKIAHGELKEGTRTRTGSILGTPYYMSPEQAQGNKAVDYRSDLWSLGVIAFECLTGTRPFFSDGLGDLVLQICVRDLPVPSAVTSVPLGFDDWFAKAVAREPDQRFQSAREMTDALREVLGIETRDAYAVTPEVVVSSADSDRPPARDADPNAPTVALDAEVVQRLAESGVEESDEQGFAKRKAEVAAELPDQVRTSDSARLERRRLSRTIESVPPPNGAGLGTIVGVAAAALALGMAGGLVWLWQHRAPAQQPAPEPPAATAEATAPSEPSAVPSGTVPVRVAERVDAVAAQPSASAAPSATPDASAAPAPSAAVPKPRPEAEPAPADAGLTAPPLPDGGWVKPAWAVPDEEPRRAPDLMEEDAP